MIFQKKKLMSKLFMDRTALLNTIDNCLFQFFTQIEKEFHLPENILRQRWMGEQSVPAPEKKKASSSLKKSNYQNFFSIQRKHIMQKDSTLSFGDISKMISAMWKILPAEEKLMYSEDRIAEKTNESAKKTDMEDESVQIIHTQKKKTKTGRSKLELSIEETEKDKDEDEDDFYFQDDMEDGSILDADDDGEMEDDDDELYDDD